MVKAKVIPRYNSVISWAVILGASGIPLRLSEFLGHGLYFPFPSRLGSFSYIRLFDPPRLFGESMTFASFAFVLFCPDYHIIIMANLGGLKYNQQ